MTLSDKLAAMGVSVDVSADTASSIGLYEDTYEYSREDILAMSKSERDTLMRLCDAKLEADEQWEVFYPLFCLISAVEDDLYRQENLASFLAYQKKMGEPDFDWDFYSDWHKEMYGYRPRG